MSDVEQIEQDDSTNHFDMHSIFNRKTPVIAENAKEKVEKKDLPKKEVEENIQAPSKEKSHAKNDREDEDQDDDKKETEKNEKDVDYKSEVEKLQKVVKDTQKSFHEDRKKLSAYKKAVEKLKENGALLDEEAEMLLDHTKFDSDPEEEPLIVKYGNIWDKELAYMKKYAPNPKEIDQHIFAFQHLIQTSTPKEAHDIIEDLSKYDSDEVELTRQMLEIGRQYNDDIYADIHESGSIRNLKEKYSQKEKELQKKIDKLEKQVNKYKEQYEDYNTEPANLRLPYGSGNIDIPKNATFDIGTIFNKRFQSR